MTLVVESGIESTAFVKLKCISVVYQLVFCSIKISRVSEFIHITDALKVMTVKLTTLPQTQHPPLPTLRSSSP